jgi:hypothetical protein
VEIGSQRPQRAVSKSMAGSREQARPGPCLPISVITVRGQVVHCHQWVIHLNQVPRTSVARRRAGRERPWRAALRRAAGRRVPPVGVQTVIPYNVADSVGHASRTLRDLSQMDNPLPPKGVLAAGHLLDLAGDPAWLRLPTPRRSAAPLPVAGFQSSAGRPARGRWSTVTSRKGPLSGLVRVNSAIAWSPMR